MNQPLVLNPEQIAATGAESLKIIDCRTAEAYAEAHLPGAIHLDTSLLGRSEPPMGGLLPNPAGAKALASAIGLRESDHVVAYDGGAGTAAARLIWVLHAYGFMATSWLNGGFNAWQSAGLPTNSENVAASVSNISLHFRPGNMLSVDALQAQLGNADLAVLDVRSAAEFDGTDVRSARGGHVPHAKHSEWTNVFNESGTLKDDAALHALFADIDINNDHHVIVYCQTHQRSALTYVVLKHLGYDNVSAIDGAWSAWGNSPTTPVDVPSA